MTKLHELYTALTKVEPKKRPSLLISKKSKENDFDMEERLFCHKERLILSQAVAGNGMVSGMNPEIGDILTVFSSLEFITNEIIISNLNINEEGTDKFYDILNQIPWADKIKIINKWNLIENKTKELLMQLKEVRNSFAHTIDPDIDVVNYKGIRLKKNFSEFKNDLIFVWDSLLKAYNNDQIDIDILIKKYL